MTIQEEVLFEIFCNRKPCSIYKLSRALPLKRFQIYNAIYHLIRRGFIKKERVKNEDAGFCNSPVHILVKVDDSTLFKELRLLDMIKKIEENFVNERKNSA